MTDHSTQPPDAEIQTADDYEAAVLDRLKAAIESSEFSIRTLEQRCGFAHDVIGRIFRNPKRLTVGFVFTVTQHLDISASEILSVAILPTECRDFADTVAILPTPDPTVANSATLSPNERHSVAELATPDPSYQTEVMDRLADALEKIAETTGKVQPSKEHIAVAFTMQYYLRYRTLPKHKQVMEEAEIKHHTQLQRLTRYTELRASIEGAIREPRKGYL